MDKHDQELHASIKEIQDAAAKQINNLECKNAKEHKNPSKWIIRNAPYEHDGEVSVDYVSLCCNDFKEKVDDIVNASNEKIEHIIAQYNQKQLGKVRFSDLS